MLLAQYLQTILPSSSDSDNTLSNYKELTMQTHFTLKHSMLAASLSLLALAPLTNVQANTTAVSGTINKIAGGTTFDTWKINVLTAGTFTVDLRAYEASQSNISTAGYYASDINGDGELTWLDPDTYFYKDDGHLDAVDALVRCDDTQNNCAVYQNGLTAITSPAVVTTHLQSETPVDGSIHFRRDPWFDVTLAAGNYLYFVGDFRLDPAEAATGINGGDSFSPPTGYINPILDHADYQITLSSETLNFNVSGNTITVSQVPLPITGWLFGSALIGFGILTRKKTGLIA